MKMGWSTNRVGAMATIKPPRSEARERAANGHGLPRGLDQSPHPLGLAASLGAMRGAIPRY